MVSHRALRLPDELAQGFVSWITEYWKILDAPDQFDPDRFNREGRALAIALKQHVGVSTKIVFVPEKGNGGLGREEEIN
jgi:hypothetical protein